MSEVVSETQVWKEEEDREEPEVIIQWVTSETSEKQSQISMAKVRELGT